MSDKGYERLIHEIKRLIGNNKFIFLGTMKTNTSVAIGDLILERDDLLINDRLTELMQGDSVLLLKINEEKYVIAERVREL